MFLEDKDYFVGPLNVPNKDLYPNSNRVGNSVILQEAIDEHEKSLMLAALGAVTYDLFFAIFETTGALKAGIDAKWTKLVNGETYTVDSKDYKWRGLRYSDGTIKKSLIADYVYCKFSENNILHLGGVGMQTLDANNATGHNAIPKITNIWNGFVRKYQGDLALDGGPQSYISNYGTTQGVDWANDSNRSYDVSLYQYLLDKNVDFPDVEFHAFATMNSFGI